MIDKRSNKKRTIASKLLSIVLSFLSIFSLCFISCIPVHAAPDITSPSYIVMEASTGRVICEENANEKRSPASITKIMT